MAVYDPPDASREWLLDRCMNSLEHTVDFKTHRLIFVDNGIRDASRDIVRSYCKLWPGRINVVGSGKNLGTARAINQAWMMKLPGEPCAKIDSDIVFNTPGWLDLLEEALRRDPKLGIVACKRRDCTESPLNEPGQWSHSELIQLPHKPGEKWLHVEKVHHAMGSAQLYAPELLDKMGYLVQMGCYGFDDSLAAVRCKAAGFYSAFLCGVDIEHPDPGGTPYQKWKESVSGERMDKFFAIAEAIRDGKRSYYAGPEEDWD